MQGADELAAKQTKQRKPQQAPSKMMQQRMTGNGMQGVYGGLNPSGTGMHAGLPGHPGLGGSMADCSWDSMGGGSPYQNQQQHQAMQMQQQMYRMQQQQQHQQQPGSMTGSGLHQQQQHQHQQQSGIMTGSGMQGQNPYRPAHGGGRGQLPASSNQNTQHMQLQMQSVSHPGAHVGKDGLQNAQMLASKGFPAQMQQQQMVARAGMQAYGIGSQPQSHLMTASSPQMNRLRTQNMPSTFSGGNVPLRQADAARAPVLSTTLSIEPQTALPQVAAARLYSYKALEPADSYDSSANDRRNTILKSVVLPSFASWFEMEEVHDIERQALADLTSSPDDSSKYLSLRNRIISLYRDIPGRPLAAMDCIRHFTEGPTIVFRVHAFLDFWGIINTDAQGRVRFQKALMLLSEPPPRSAGSAIAAAVTKDKEKDAVKGFAKCAITGEPLLRVSYASKSDPSYMISPTSYMQGMMAPHMSPSDFIRRVNDDKVLQTFPSHDDWTEEETSILLDAISKVGETWDVVAEMVKTKTMEQCVLQFARLPIADRYLEDVHPTHFGTLSAFPDEWAPEWTQWLQGLVKLNKVDAAALGPALGAAMAAIDGTLDSTTGGHSLEAVEGRTNEQHQPSTNEQPLSIKDKATESPPRDYHQEHEVEDLSSTRHDPPWMRVLKWPPPAGLPRNKHLKKGDCVVLLSEEAGPSRRGRVHEVHSAKNGIMSIEMGGGGGVKVLQLARTHYRVVSAEEVATIERAIGCAFMQRSATEEQGENEDQQHADIAPVEPFQVVKAACSWDGSTRGAAQAPLSRPADDAVNVQESAEHAKNGGESNLVCGAACSTGEVGGWGLWQGQSLANARGGNVQMHRSTLWDESGAPAMRCTDDLSELRQAAETAREDDVYCRQVTIKLVQAKIAKTAQRLHNAERADRALCELRESIRSRQRELLIEKRKTHAPQYRPKQGSILGLMGDEEDQDTRDRKMHAIYGGGRESLGRTAKNNRTYDVQDDLDLDDD